MNPEVEGFTSAQGSRIYRLPLDLFPGLSGYAHLVIAQDVQALIDVGSGFGVSNEQLETGLENLRQEYGEKVSWSSLTHVLITHSHIDHFGGLRFVRERTRALVGVHELDLRVLTNYEERVALVAHRLREFLGEAGLSADDLSEVMDLYLLNKHLFSSTPVDFTYEAVGMRIGPIELIHVPGHTPGQVMVKVDDLLLSADHILEHISPHLAPERLTLNTGLGHYLVSLDRSRRLAGDVRLTLGAHQGVIEDLTMRVDEIERLYRERLETLLQRIQTPKTIADLSKVLFPDVDGYDKLLALEEMGAYVEYLHQRGHLGIENVEDLETDAIRPIRFRRLDGIAPLIENRRRGDLSAPGEPGGVR